jgi:hypothetical protein
MARPPLTLPLIITHFIGKYIQIATVCKKKLTKQPLYHPPHTIIPSEGHIAIAEAAKLYKSLAN